MIPELEGNSVVASRPTPPDGGHEILAMVQAEAKYRGLLEVAPDAMVVVDPNGKIVLLNIRAEEQFGYPHDELLGQKVTTILPDGFAELAQQIGTGIELSGRRKNGSEFPVDIMLSPLDGPGGIMVTAAIRDISARKRADQHLAWTVSASERLAAIVASCDDAILSEALDGTITSWNKSAESMFGYKAEEAVGQNVRLIIPPERQGEQVTILAEIKIGRRIDHYETEWLARDGLRVAVSISISPLYDQARQIVGVAEIVRDMTSRHKHDVVLETARQTLAIEHSALLRSNSELEEFGYAVSHDLKAPLRAIGLLAEWIDEDIKGTASPETTENLALLRMRVERMNMLITSLLDYCRNDQSSNVIEDVEVGAVVDDIVAMLGPPPGFVVLYEGQSLVFRTSRVALQVVT